jgi:hypothetical protein
LESDKTNLAKGIQYLMNIDLGGQSRILVLGCEFGDVWYLLLKSECKAAPCMTLI